MNPKARAYNYCLAIARNHYENFPVASIMVPKPKRQVIASIYAFARSADDFADEGDLTADQRLTELNRLDLAAQQLPNFEHDNLIIQALSYSFSDYKLDQQLLSDLITAFKQDVSKHRYNNFAEVLGYCKNSADPIGRLLLQLNGTANEINYALSDKICSALQLINFYQDLASDLQERQRLYVPLDELKQFAVSETMLIDNIDNTATQKLINLQLNRAQIMLYEGAELGLRLKQFFGVEIRAIVLAANYVLQQLKQRTSIYQRPTINKVKLCCSLVAALSPTKYQRLLSI